MKYLIHEGTPVIKGNYYLSTLHLDAERTHSREGLLLHSSPVRTNDIINAR